jgi:hypothetical protein
VPVNAKSRLQAVLILITVFISGGLLGVAVDRQMVPTEAEVQESGEEEQGEERRTRERIVDQVGLSEVQKVQVDSIVETARVRMGPDRISGSNTKPHTGRSCWRPGRPSRPSSRWSRPCSTTRFWPSAMPGGRPVETKTINGTTDR